VSSRLVCTVISAICSTVGTAGRGLARCDGGRLRPATVIGIRPASSMVLISDVMQHWYIRQLVYQFSQYDVGDYGSKGIRYGSVMKLFSVVD
jgi:hypothetical protein